MRLGSVVQKILVLILILTLSVAAFGCAEEVPAEPTETTTLPPLDHIAVLGLTLDENTKKAYNGFFSALADNGYKKDSSITVSQTFCKAEEELSSAAEALVSEGADLIYVIGTDAAIAVKNATSKIPVVFSCVEDPVGTGLVKSCEAPEGNITGVCDYPPVFEQIELIEELYPNVKSIASVYNGADEESIFTANLAKGEAQAEEIKFTLYPVLTEKAYYKDLDKALEKCDALYLPDDALVKSTLKTTLKRAKEEKVPVFAESTELVELGCLATCITDYEDIGYSAGELGAILLRGLKPLSQVPVEYADDCTAVINAKVQKSLKLTLPEDVKEDVVFVNNAG